MAMKENLLQPENKDVTKPEQITMFNKNDNDEHKNKPKSKQNARKRVDTSERFKMNRDELKKIMFANAENIERRDNFIKNNTLRDNLDLTETDENSLNLDTNFNNASLYGFKMSIYNESQLQNERIPIKLSWRDISYRVTIKSQNNELCKQKTEKIILNNISGDVLNGKLVAIMV